jgi:hypothetical protein
MTILTRAAKGSALSHAEMDNNLEELRDKPDGQVYPKTQGIGIKVDTASPTFPWKDLVGVIDRSGAGGNNPTSATYIGNIKQYQFATSDECTIEFHLPHDYVVGSHIYIHAHWSHNSASVSTGGITWDIEATYSKGHGQAAFSSPITLSLSQTASTTQYHHHLIEAQFSTTGGSSSTLNTTNLEPDGLILVRCVLASNTMSAATDPFLHSVDIHYQTTGLDTKNRSPNFWT